MTRLLLVLFAGTSLLGQAQDEKPSPVPSKNKRTFTKAVVSDEPPPKSEVKPTSSSPRISDATKVVVVDGSGENGRATYYREELHGRKGASGETIDMNDLTAAHASLPLGSRAKVTNTVTGQSVVVRINDRFRSGTYVINISLRAAQEIGLTSNSSQPVKIEAVR